MYTLRKANVRFIVSTSLNNMSCILLEHTNTNIRRQEGLHQCQTPSPTIRLKDEG